MIRDVTKMIIFLCMITSSYKKIIVFVFFVVCAEVILIPVVLAGACCTKYCVSRRILSTVVSVP